MYYSDNNNNIYHMTRIKRNPSQFISFTVNKENDCKTKLKS